MTLENFEFFDVNVSKNTDEIDDFNSDLVCDMLLENIDFRKFLVIGKVQSGKTKNMINVVSKIINNYEKYKFESIVIFTGIKNILNAQNYDRFRNHFNPDYVNVVDLKNSTAVSSIKESLPTIYFTLKNKKGLERVENMLNTDKFKKYLFIDDEADHASQNNNNNSNKVETSTYKKIKSILGNHTNVVYVGYTATPQAILGGGESNYLFPDKSIILSTSEGYFGVRDFVENSDHIYKEINDNDTYSDEGYVSDTLENALRYYFDFLKNLIKNNIDLSLFQIGYGINMVIHNSQYKYSHDNSSSSVENILEEYESEYKCDLGITIKILNQNQEDKELFTNDESKAKNYILIGGEMLGRGYTIPNLLVFYSSRSSKEYNLDTIYQRTRFCGYRQSYKDYIRIYLPSEIFPFINDIITNEKVIADLINSKDNSTFPSNNRKNIWFISDSNKLYPTRKGVINSKYNYKESTKTFQTLCDISKKEHYVQNSEIIKKYIDDDTNIIKSYYHQRFELVEIIELIKKLNISIDSYNSIYKILSILSYTEGVTYDSEKISIDCFLNKNLINEQYTPGENYRTQSEAGVFTFIGQTEVDCINSYDSNNDYNLFIKRISLKYQNGSEKEGYVFCLKIPDKKQINIYETN